MQERTTTHPHAGEKAGNRVRGAFETVRGIGENVRGSTLGAVDAMAGDAPDEHDAIAQRGRQKTQRGYEDMHNLPHTGMSSDLPSGRGAGTGSGGGSLGANVAQPEPTTHHHRDDAISGLPTSETRELQGRYEDQRAGFRRPEYN